MREAPVFVVGAQRSGTTIIAEMLARTIGPGLVVNGKLAYYLAVWLLANAPEWDGRHVRLDEIAHALRRVPPRNVAGAALECAIEWLLKAGPGICAESATAADAVSRLWFGFQTRLAPGAAVAGEKYNELLLHLDRVLSAFPDARFIFIFRDPADVTASMVRHFEGRPWAPATVAEAALKYVAWNAAWERARVRIGVRNRYEICYEDFAQRPTAVLEDCCRSLRLPACAPVPVDAQVLRSSWGPGAGAGTAGDGALSAATEWYARARARGAAMTACAR